MTLPNIKKDTSELRNRTIRTSLTRPLVQTLLLLSLIPLILMSVAAYLQARRLLEAQTYSQMEALGAHQLGLLKDALATNREHLENLVNRPGLVPIIEEALHANRQNSGFATIRKELIDELTILESASTDPAFDQILLVRPDWIIQVATRPEWEGMSTPINWPCLRFNLTGPHPDPYWGS
jgi:hypothetical protein